MEVTGRAAIVTGGASGIVAAIARELVRRGARVVVADRDGAAARRLARELAGPNGDRAVDVCADWRRESDARSFHDEMDNTGPRRSKVAVSARARSVIRASRIIPR